MKTKLIILAIALTLVPSVANASRGYSHPHIARSASSRSVNINKGYRHIRLAVPRKGTVVVYNP